MQNIPTRNVMKDDFGWEVPVETIPLPTRGVLYDPSSNLHCLETVKIKAMTAKEEDILASQAYIKEGTVIEKLIESCLIDKNIDVYELTSGDKNAIMLGIRITGYGSQYPVKSVCENCGSKNDVDIDLTEVPIKRLGIEPTELGQNLFEFKLPITGKVVKFKYLNGHDELERDKIAKRYKEMGIQKQTTVTDFLENVIISIDNVTDKNKIKHFVQNMPALDSKKLRTYIKENESGMDMKWKYQCNSCSHSNEIFVPVTSEFFWPST